MTELGLIIHMGLYSVYGFDDIKSLRRRKTQNGSEWYQRRLTEKSDYRPVSGHVATKEYHKEHYGDASYYDVISQFDEDSLFWRPDVWMKAFVKRKVDYVILTAKHHDGFCLFDTKTTSCKSKRNIIGEFVESARKYGIKVGIYYSLCEFNVNVTKKYIEEIMLPQMAELRKYKPDIWWFDGHWCFSTKFAHNSLKELSKLLKEDNPDVEINDRIVYDYTYNNFSDRHIPEVKPETKWESVQTIGISWGFCRTQERKDYKTGEELFDLYKKVKELGGKFLLNLGPQSNGIFDENEAKSLVSFCEMRMKEDEK